MRQKVESTSDLWWAKFNAMFPETETRGKKGP